MEVSFSAPVNCPFPSGDSPKMVKPVKYCNSLKDVICSVGGLFDQ